MCFICTFGHYFICVGQGGNDFGDEFKDCKLNNTPLVTIYAKPVVGTKDLIFEPGLHGIRGLVQLCFEKIIEVNQKLPRIDCLLFPGMCMMYEDRQFFNIIIYNYYVSSSAGW
jgi:hypothetical protein